VKSDKDFILTGLIGGFGINILGLRTDYSFVPYGDLGQSHQLTLNLKF